MTALFATLSDRAVEFVRRPTPVPADLRPVWRIALLALLLDHCRGSSATAQQIHALDWAARVGSDRSDLLAFLRGDYFPKAPIIRVDPAVSRAINIACAAGLFRADGNARVRRTDSGDALALAVRSDVDLFVHEKRFLSTLPRKVSNADMQRLLEIRGAS